MESLIKMIKVRLTSTVLRDKLNYYCNDCNDDIDNNSNRIVT